MRAARLALCLAVAIGAAPTLWISKAVTAEPEESEAAADQSPAPTIYKWIDEHGIAHYTTDRDRIPGDLRDRVGRLGPPDATLKRTPVEPSAPATPSRSASEFDEGEPSAPATPSRSASEFDEGEPSAPATPSRSAPKSDEGEEWAVRDRGVERPRDAWDQGDPYAGQAAVAPVQGDLPVSEAELEDRRRRLEDLDGRIAALQTDIAASEEALKALLVVPVPEGGGPLAMADDPTFRDVADRLPKLLASLRALQDERAELAAP
jgi:hypothetical protein